MTTPTEGRLRLYGHAFAAAYDPVMRGLEQRRLSARRAELLADLTGHVVDVGAGTGANLPHLPASVDRVTCIEPDPALAARLRRRLREHPTGVHAARADGVPIDRVEVVDAVAEALPLPDGSADAVLLTLVLCSVADPALAVAEARRALRDAGVLVVIEHVRAENDLGSRAQRLLTPVWRRLARGCHLDRDTRATLQHGGFDVEAVRAWELGGRRPRFPTIAGHALPR